MTIIVLMHYWWQRKVALSNKKQKEDKKQKETFETELKKIFHKDIALNISIDSALLGGFKLQVNSQLLDATIQSKLLKIKKLAIGM